MNARVKPVYGIGINDANYKLWITETISGKQRIAWECPIYRGWANMLERCYSPKLHARNPSYIGCTVAQEWHSFSVFREWMIAQPWEGNHLDKDILFPGNKVYGPETCVFVSGALNNFLTDHRSASGEWPLGVTWHKRDKKFMAACSNPINRKREFIGYFDCHAAAHEAWRRRKHQHACRYADQQTDERIAAALRKRFDIVV